MYLPSNFCEKNKKKLFFFFKKKIKVIENDTEESPDHQKKTRLASKEDPTYLQSYLKLDSFFKKYAYMHSKPSHRRIQSENNINIDLNEDFPGKIFKTPPRDRRPSQREIAVIHANSQIKSLRKSLKKERENNINAIIKKKSMEITKFESSPEFMDDDFSETESDKEKKRNFLKSGFTWEEIQTADGTNIKSMISIEENEEDKDRIAMHEIFKLKAKKKYTEKKKGTGWNFCSERNNCTCQIF